MVGGESTLVNYGSETYLQWIDYARCFKKLCTDQFGDANNGHGLLCIVRRLLSRHSNEDQDHEIRNCLVANAVKYMFYGTERMYSGENRKIGLV